MNLRKNLVNYEEIFLIANGLSLYLKSGIAIKKSLELVKITVKNKNYIKALDRIILLIDSGSSIGEAFSKEGELFTNDFVDMLMMAEESGTMEKSLFIIANSFERQIKLKKDIKKKLAYPILLIVTMVVVFTLIIIFVIPTLANMYQSTEGELSIFTKVMLSINNFFQRVNPVIFLISLIAIIFLLILIFREVTRNKDLLGNLAIVKSYRELKVILIFEMVIKSGIPIISAIEKLKMSIKDKELKHNFFIINEGLSNGCSLIESMKKTMIISNLSESFLFTAEETGNLDEGIERLIVILEYQFNGRVNKAIFYVEPVSILLLGIMVLILVLMVFVPMYEYMNYV
ncbi:MAG: type II secretion system F family protein [Sarcina sp.]